MASMYEAWCMTGASRTDAPPPPRRIGRCRHMQQPIVHRTAAEQTHEATEAAVEQSWLCVTCLTYRCRTTGLPARTHARTSAAGRVYMGQVAGSRAEPGTKGGRPCKGRRCMPKAAGRRATGEGQAMNGERVDREGRIEAIMCFILYNGSGAHRGRHQVVIRRWRVLP